MDIANPLNSKTNIIHGNALSERELIYSIEYPTGNQLQNSSDEEEPINYKKNEDLKQNKPRMPRAINIASDDDIQKYLKSIHLKPRPVMRGPAPRPMNNYNALQMIADKQNI